MEWCVCRNEMEFDCEAVLNVSITVLGLITSVRFYLFGCMGFWYCVWRQMNRSQQKSHQIFHSGQRHNGIAKLVHWQNAHCLCIAKVVVFFFCRHFTVQSSYHIKLGKTEHNKRTGFNDRFVCIVHHCVPSHTLSFSTALELVVMPL